MIKVAVIGASGYTGAEAIRIIVSHSQAELVYLTALEEECGRVGEVFGQFMGRFELDIEPLDFEKLSGLADVALCCLPHRVSMQFVPKLLDAGVKVIDFSADYRLKDVAVYEAYYKVRHSDVANIERAGFGLPELFREDIQGRDLVANPGCYPTGAALAVAPLLKEGFIETDSIIVNAVTGITGGGRNPTNKFHFPNMNENFFAYGIGTHRHMPEMEQIASEVCGSDVKILFQPHAGPFDRGILSSVYCRPKQKISDDKLQEIYSEFYAEEPFVQVLESSPALKDVAGTNYCHIFPRFVKGRVVVFSAIDNLVKGASGQAVQNMNIIFGLDETLGLR